MAGAAPAHPHTVLRSALGNEWRIWGEEPAQGHLMARCFPNTRAAQGPEIGLPGPGNVNFASGWAGRSEAQVRLDHGPSPPAPEPSCCEFLAAPRATLASLSYIAHLGIHQVHYRHGATRPSSPPPAAQGTLLYCAALHCCLSLLPAARCSHCYRSMSSRTSRSRICRMSCAVRRSKAAFMSSSLASCGIGGATCYSIVRGLLCYPLLLGPGCSQLLRRVTRRQPSWPGPVPSPGPARRLNRTRRLPRPHPPFSLPYHPKHHLLSFLTFFPSLPPPPPTWSSSMRSSMLPPTT